MNTAGSTGVRPRGRAACHLRFGAALVLWTLLVALVVPVLGFGSVAAWLDHPDRLWITFILFLVVLGGAVVLRQLLVPRKQDR